jgi:glycine oxidase
MNNSQSSSTVAGGVYNPVILKRFTLAWNAAATNGNCHSVLQGSGRQTGSKPLVEELPIYRKFNSIEEQNNWFAAADKRSLAPFWIQELKAGA